jgi:predicted transcriptional regulator
MFEQGKICMEAPKIANNDNLIELTCDIVCAFAGHNAISASDLPKLLSDIYAALGQVATNVIPVETAPQKPPAVSIRKSITPDYIVRLEDGRKFKSLKRHLRTRYDMTPEQYREKWKLPSDYPMVAPNYSDLRASLAVSNGLGRKAGAIVAKSTKAKTRA